MDLGANAAIREGVEIDINKSITSTINILILVISLHMKHYVIKFYLLFIYCSN